MNAYVVTARELSARVTSWPDTGDPVTVSFEYLCYNAKTQVIKDFRGPMLLCRCGCAVRGLVEHPGGRGLICADCHRKVTAMFERKTERQSGGLQSHRDASANARKGTQKPATASKRGKPITLPQTPRKSRVTRKVA